MSEPFLIDSDEGLPIRGDFDLPREPEALVIVVHGFKGFKDWGFFPWLAQYLCAEGHAVCRFNMSRSGIGERPETFERLDLFAGDTYKIQLADLRCVVEHAQERFPSLPTFLFGHSRGGGVALLGAADVANLRGIVTWNSISSVVRWDEATRRQWRRDGHLDVINARTKQVMRMSTAMLDDYETNRDALDIRAAVRRLGVPLLVVHGARDESVPVREAYEIVEAAPDALRVIVGSGTHTFNAVHPLKDVPFELSLAAAVSSHFVRVYR